MKNLSPMVRYHLLLILSVWTLTLLYVWGLIPETLTDRFLVFSGLLNTHRPWFYAAYEFRDEIVVIHYFTFFAIFPSFLLGAFVTQTHQQKQAIQKISYLRLILCLGLTIVLGLALLFWFGSEVLIEQGVSSFRKSPSTRFLNSFIGILLLQWMTLTVWIYVGYFLRSLIFKKSY